MDLVVMFILFFESLWSCNYMIHSWRVFNTNDFSSYVLGHGGHFKPCKSFICGRDRGFGSHKNLFWTITSPVMIYMKYYFIYYLIKAV